MATSNSFGPSLQGTESSDPPSSVGRRSRSSAITTISATGSNDPLVTQADAATPRTPTFVSGLQAIRENKQGDAVEGWPLLARLMAEKPDFEAFARYKELYVKNLLYYQVELASIKVRLERWEKSDRDLDPELHEEAEFYKLADRLLDTESDQRDEVLRLRKTLNGYSKALLQYAQVSSLPGPSTRNINTLVRWLQSANAGNFKVDGRGSRVWNASDTSQPLVPSLRRLISSIFLRQKVPPTRHDLVAPRGRKSVDGLTRWIAEEAIPFWYAARNGNSDEDAGRTGTGSGERDVEKVMPSVLQTEKGGEADGGEALKDLKLDYVQSYSGSSLVGFTTRVTTLFACMVPMVAIFALSAVDEQSIRLGLTATFTAVFCGLVMTVTEATRVQVFTASSAFLAVLVVFVQNQ